MKYGIYLLSMALAIGACITPASAAQLRMAPEQQWLLEAAQTAVAGDYPGAIVLYNQVLQQNPGHVDALLQRALLKREVKDGLGQQADARRAWQLANTQVEANPRKAKAYWRRGMAYRLAQDFEPAKRDIRYAIELKGGQKLDWQTDLRAIELEERMYQ